MSNIIYEDNYAKICVYHTWHNKYPSIDELIDMLSELKEKGFESEPLDYDNDFGGEYSEGLTEVSLSFRKKD